MRKNNGKIKEASGSSLKVILLIFILGIIGLLFAPAFYTGTNIELFKGEMLYKHLITIFKDVFMKGEAVAVFGSINYIFLAFMGVIALDILLFFVSLFFKNAKQVKGIAVFSITLTLLVSGLAFILCKNQLIISFKLAIKTIFAFYVAFCFIITLLCALLGKGTRSVAKTLTFILSFATLIAFAFNMISVSGIAINGLNTVIVPKFLKLNHIELITLILPLSGTTEKFSKIMLYGFTALMALAIINYALSAFSLSRKKSSKFNVLRTFLQLIVSSALLTAMFIVVKGFEFKNSYGLLAITAISLLNFILTIIGSAKNKRNKTVKPLEIKSTKKIDNTTEKNKVVTKVFDENKKIDPNINSVVAKSEEIKDATIKDQTKDQIKETSISNYSQEETKVTSAPPAPLKENVKENTDFTFVKEDSNEVNSLIKDIISDVANKEPIKPEIKEISKEPILDTSKKESTETQKSETKKTDISTTDFEELAKKFGYVKESTAAVIPEEKRQEIKETISFEQPQKNNNVEPTNSNINTNKNTESYVVPDYSKLNKEKEKQTQTYTFKPTYSEPNYPTYPVYQGGLEPQQIAIPGIKITDTFFESLTYKEKEEFDNIFIRRIYGDNKRLPIYKIGEDNKDFFSKVFIFIGRYRNLISESLLAKIYAYSNSL